MRKTLLLTLVFLLLFAAHAVAQVGEYRNVFSIGVNGGYKLTGVGFSPKVTHKYLPCTAFGLSFRYTSEKYFTALCSLVAEVNWSQMGWAENILTENHEPVLNPVTGEAEEYERHISYVQIPIMAHMAWGREVKGLTFFIEIGPQFGVYLGESTHTNFDSTTMNTQDRANSITAQYDMPVEKKFDYGIVGGLGLEYSHPAVGHFRLEARYYYGLANIYGASKRDYFSKSNQNAIEFKLAYLVDIAGRKTRGGLKEGK